jgi:uncharacterized LabA/DUF88 family protein
MLNSFGYELIFKPTVQTSAGVKGNIDAELVLYAAKIEYYNYDSAVIVTGDGDFACLIDYLQKNKKLKRLVIPNKNSQSRLLSKYEKKMLHLDEIRFKVERK